MHVNAHGTLRIQGVQREDAGWLICNALSVAGSSSIRAFLQVIRSLIIFLVHLILRHYLNYTKFPNTVLKCGFLICIYL